MRSRTDSQRNSNVTPTRRLDSRKPNPGRANTGGRSTSTRNATLREKIGKSKTRNSPATRQKRENGGAANSTSNAGSGLASPPGIVGDVDIPNESWTTADKIRQRAKQSRVNGKRKPGAKAPFDGFSSEDIEAASNSQSGIFPGERPGATSRRPSKTNSKTTRLGDVLSNRRTPRSENPGSAGQKKPSPAASPTSLADILGGKSPALERSPSKLKKRLAETNDNSPNANDESSGEAAQSPTDSNANQQTAATDSNEESASQGDSGDYLPKDDEKVSPGSGSNGPLGGLLGQAQDAAGVIIDTVGETADDIVDEITNPAGSDAPPDAGLADTAQDALGLAFDLAEKSPIEIPDQLDAESAIEFGNDLIEVGGGVLENAGKGIRKQGNKAAGMLTDPLLDHANAAVDEMDLDLPERFDAESGMGFALDTLGGIKGNIDSKIEHDATKTQTKLSETASGTIDILEQGTDLFMGQAGTALETTGEMIDGAIDDYKTQQLRNSARAQRRNQRIGAMVGEAGEQFGETVDGAMDEFRSQQLRNSARAHRRNQRIGAMVGEAGEQVGEMIDGAMNGTGNSIDAAAENLGNAANQAGDRLSKGINRGRAYASDAKTTVENVVDSTYGSDNNHDPSDGVDDYIEAALNGQIIGAKLQNQHLKDQMDRAGIPSAGIPESLNAPIVAVEQMLKTESAHRQNQEMIDEATARMIQERQRGEKRAEEMAARSDRQSNQPEAAEPAQVTDDGTNATDVQGVSNPPANFDNSDDSRSEPRRRNGQQKKSGTSIRDARETREPADSPDPKQNFATASELNRDIENWNSSDRDPRSDSASTRPRTDDARNNSDASKERDDTNAERNESAPSRADRTDERTSDDSRSSPDDRPSNNDTGNRNDRDSDPIADRSEPANPSQNNERRESGGSDNLETETDPAGDSGHGFDLSMWGEEYADTGQWTGEGTSFEADAGTADMDAWIETGSVVEQPSDETLPPENEQPRIRTDLEIVDVRFVDLGATVQQINEDTGMAENVQRGPKFRISIRNHNNKFATEQVGIELIAAIDLDVDDPVQSTSSGMIASIPPGQTVETDLILLPESLQLSESNQGAKIPFAQLAIIVDPDEAFDDVDPDNNVVVKGVDEIESVEMNLIKLSTDSLLPNSRLVASGEGFGFDTGAVAIAVQGKVFPMPVAQWTPTSIEATVPNFKLTRALPAKLIIVRPDKEKTAPQDVRITPPPISK